MDIRKYRWSKAYESAEEELVLLLAAKNITAERWTAAAGEHIKPQVDEHGKQLWCAEGSTTLLVNGRTISLQAGDALNLPAHTIYETTAGINGCACYESRLSDQPEALQ